MTMEPHYYQLDLVQGATLYTPFAIENVDGTTMNLVAEGDGYTVGRLQIRDKPASEGGVLLTDPLTTDNGGVVINAFTDASGDWSGYWLINAEVTAAIVPFGEAVYDFEIADSDGPAARVERPFYGVCRLKPEVTV